MFGKSKKSPEQYGQMPYEVYETIHGPAARRRRWAVRLVAALLAVTLLVIGGTALKGKLDSASNSSGNGQVTRSNGAAGQSTAGNNGGRGQQPNAADQAINQAASQQAPQANTPLQKSDANPVTIPQSGTVNTGTVNQPE